MMLRMIKRFFILILPLLWMPCYVILVLVSPICWIITGKDTLFDLAEELDSKVEKCYWDNT